MTDKVRGKLPKTAIESERVEGLLIAEKLAEDILSGKHQRLGTRYWENLLMSYSKRLTEITCMEPTEDGLPVAEELVTALNTAVDVDNKLVLVRLAPVVRGLAPER